MVFLVAVFAVFAGRDAWTTFPILLGACVLFLLADADILTRREDRLVDVPLITGLCLLGLQLIPLPGPVVQALSPHAEAAQRAYAIAPLDVAWRPLTVHPGATRTALSLALSAALTFWAARSAFARGGRRSALFLLSGLATCGAIMSVAQRITAPRTLLWIRRLPDPRAMPFGPFVDRNQLATWLLLVIMLTLGLLVMEVRHEGGDDDGSWRRLLQALSRGGTPTVVVGLLLMLATLAATVSRSGAAGLVVAVAAFTALGRTSSRRRLQAVLGTMGLLLVLAVFVNAEGLASRVSDTLGPTTAGRVEIWRSTLPIVFDFPFVGTGGGTFADVMLLYQHAGWTVLFNHAHNEYLQLLAEGGVLLLGIVAVGVGGLVAVARARLRHDHGGDRWMRVGACAALIGIAVQSLWETGLRSPANLLLAAMVAALAVADPRARRHRSTQ